MAYQPLPVKGQATMAESLPVVIASNQSPVPVTGSFTISPTPANETQVLFGEQLAVASGVTATIINFTPLVDTLILSIDALGGNISIFELIFESAVIERKRSYFSNFNIDFNMQGFVVHAGENLKVQAVHNRPSTCDFNATMKFAEV